MFETQWRKLLRRIPMNHPTTKRQRTTRRLGALLAPPAEVVEVLESRLLPSADFLAFAVQPSNAIAGHGLSLTVDVMTTVRERARPVIDTTYNGIATGVPTGPQAGFDFPFNFAVVPEQNMPISNWSVFIIHGVGKMPPDFLALDTAGTYTITLTAPPVPDSGIPGVPGSVTSNPFTISPFTNTDHIVFLNVPSLVDANVPFNVTVAVEDQFGNIDTSVSNAPVILGATGGNVYMTQLSAGQATFTGVTLPAAPPNPVLFSQDFLGVIGFGGPTGFVFGSAFVTVVSPNSGG
jgi:hypothetical protein